ncbi:hypothetical protein RP20_CCG012176 [Aedes albopictus]|nr:hypothetical protein RP20_CCG012176 [Aedes albopictus]
MPGIYAGIWYKEELDFIENRRGGFSLRHKGYHFITERRYNNRVRGFLYDEQYELVCNRKGGLNLCYRGYLYRKKTQFANTLNWVCANPNYNRFAGYGSANGGLCGARCITNNSGGLKLSKKGHNHPPMLQYDEGTSVKLCIETLENTQYNSD